MQAEHNFAQLPLYPHNAHTHTSHTSYASSSLRCTLVAVGGLLALRSTRDPPDVSTPGVTAEESGGVSRCLACLQPVLLLLGSVWGAPERKCVHSGITRRVCVFNTCTIPGVCKSVVMAPPVGDSAHRAAAGVVAGDCTLRSLVDASGDARGPSVDAACSSRRLCGRVGWGKEACVAVNMVCVWF